MKNNYLIRIHEVGLTKNNIKENFLILNENELGLLLSHLDDKYKIGDIYVLNDYIGSDWKKFVKKQDNLELGKKVKKGERNASK